MPGCPLEVHALEGSAQDELFHALRKPDALASQTAFAALSGRIGGHPEALADAYRQPLETMQQTLFACKEAVCTVPGKKSLSASSATLSPGTGDHLAELKGPLTTAATFAENLQLEYLEGMPDAEVGWGRADGAQVLSLMALHAASSDLVQRTPAIARPQAAHLLDTIVRTLQQAESGKPVPGAIGPAGERAVFLVGHDTNISNLAALLDAHWLVDGYQRDDAAPGGALVFTLWPAPASPTRSSSPTGCKPRPRCARRFPYPLVAPPASAPIFLPACSLPSAGSPCTWSDFQQTAQTALSAR